VATCIVRRVIPIGFPSAISASVPIPPRFLQAEAPASQPFSIVLHNLQASDADDTPEIPERKAPSARKATLSQAPSADPRSAKPGDHIVPVQNIIGRQPQPIFLRPSLSLGSGADQTLTDKSIPDRSSGNSGGAAASLASQDGTEALPQLAPPLSAVAFSINLQKIGSSDQERTTPPANECEQRSSTGSVGQQNTDTIKGSQPSDPSANRAAGNGESSPPDTGSHQSGAESDKPPNLKLDLPAQTKQEATPADAQNLTVSPAQRLANAPVSLGTGPQQTPGRATADIRPVAPPETPETPVPASARQIDLTVPNDAGHQVDIRISQRGGDVQVTVRTPDSELAQSLRHNLPELSETLSRNGLREDLSQTAQSHSAGDGNSPESSPDGGQRQGRQDPEDQSGTAGRSRSGSRQSGSFTEMIHEEKRSA